MAIFLVFHHLLLFLPFLLCRCFSSSAGFSFACFTFLPYSSCDSQERARLMFWLVSLGKLREAKRVKTILIANVNFVVNFVLINCFHATFVTRNVTQRNAFLSHAATGMPSHAPLLPLAHFVNQELSSNSALFGLEIKKFPAQDRWTRKENASPRSLLPDSRRKYRQRNTRITGVCHGHYLSPQVFSQSLPPVQRYLPCNKWEKVI